MLYAAVEEVTGALQKWAKKGTLAMMFLS